MSVKLRKKEPAKQNSSKSENSNRPGDFRYNFVERPVSSDCPVSPLFGDRHAEFKFVRTQVSTNIDNERGVDGYIRSLIGWI